MSSPFVYAMVYQSVHATCWKLCSFWIVLFMLPLTVGKICKRCSSRKNQDLYIMEEIEMYCSSILTNIHDLLLYFLHNANNAWYAPSVCKQSLQKGVLQEHDSIHHTWPSYHQKIQYIHPSPNQVGIYQVHYIIHPRHSGETNIGRYMTWRDLIKWLQ